MTIETLLILNSIALGIGVISMLALFVLLMRSERKLSKYGESWFFKRKGGK